MPLDLRHINERTPSITTMEAIIALFGEGKSYTRAEASARLEISPRTFRANVAVLNDMGYPIISDGKAFRFAVNAEDIAKAKKRLQSAVRNLQKRVDALEIIESKFEAFKEGKVQLSFF